MVSILVMSHLKSYCQYVGEKLKATRKDRKLTQIELANLAGVGVEQISRWESGRYEMTLYSALRMAKALQASMEDLYG